MKTFIMMALTISAISFFSCNKEEMRVIKTEHEITQDSEVQKYAITPQGKILRNGVAFAVTVGYVYDTSGVDSVLFEELKSDIISFTGATNTWKYVPGYCANNPCYDRKILRFYFTHAADAGWIKKGDAQSDDYNELLSDIFSI